MGNKRGGEPTPSESGSQVYLDGPRDEEDAEEENFVEKTDRRPTRKSLEMWSKLREAYSFTAVSSGSAEAIAAVLELRERIKAQIRVRLPSNISSTLQVCDSYTCGLAVDEFISTRDGKK